MAVIIGGIIDAKLSFQRQLTNFSIGVFPSLIANLQSRFRRTRPPMDSPIHQRRRPLTEQELSNIPWLHLLLPDERERAVSVLIFSRPSTTPNQ